MTQKFCIPLALAGLAAALALGTAAVAAGNRVPKGPSEVLFGLAGALLWGLFALCLVMGEGRYAALSPMCIVLHCVFCMVNMGRWAEKP